MHYINLTYITELNIVNININKHSSINSNKITVIKIQNCISILNPTISRTRLPHRRRHFVGYPLCLKFSPETIDFFLPPYNMAHCYSEYKHIPFNPYNRLTSRLSNLIYTLFLDG